MQVFQATEQVRESIQRAWEDGTRALDVGQP